MAMTRPSSPTVSMTAADAMPILTRWVRELTRDLNLANYRVRQLELRLHIKENAPLDDVYSFWLDNYPPDRLVNLAAELELVA